MCNMDRRPGSSLVSLIDNREGQERTEWKEVDMGSLQVNVEFECDRHGKV